MSHQFHESMVESVFEDMTEELGMFPTKEELDAQVEKISSLFDYEGGN